MPLHDWTRVSAGSYHGFHSAWITELARSLNNGVLPPRFYAEAEQVVGQTSPDVLALEFDSQRFDLEESVDSHNSSRMATLLDTQPQVA